MKLDVDAGRSQSDVLYELELIYRTISDAAHEYFRTANRLCQRLAEVKGLPVDALLRCRMTCGVMDDEWAWNFHGLQCRFENIRTKQVVEAELTLGGGFGAIDPWFFQIFVETTPHYRAVSPLARDTRFNIWPVMKLLGTKQMRC